MPNYFDEKSHNRFLSWTHNPTVNVSIGVVVEGHPLHQLLEFVCHGVSKEDLTPDKAGRYDPRNYVDDNMEWRTFIQGTNRRNKELDTHATRQEALDALDDLAMSLINHVRK